MRLLLAFTFTLLAISFSAYSQCFIPIGWSGIEDSDASNRLKIDMPNDRNIYFYYHNQNDNYDQLLSHKIYACDGKHLYVVPDREEHMELFALIEQMPGNRIKLHMLDSSSNIRSSLQFVTQGKSHKGSKNR